MPDSGPVNALRARLAGTLTIGRAQRDPGWGDPKAMKAALKGVRQVFGAGSGMECPSREEMATAVRTFFRERSAAQQRSPNSSTFVMEFRCRWTAMASD